MFSILVLMATNLFALTPLDSQLYGDFSKSYIEEKSDPLTYIVRPIPGDLKSHQSHLILLRAHYSEAERLKNRCSDEVTPVSFRTIWDEESAIRSYISLLQYIGLDITTRAIAKYAKELSIDETQYEQLATNLVGNYCSGNLSVISLKELKNNLMVKYQYPNSYVLPSVKNNPTYKKIGDDHISNKLHREREFALTTELFKAFCSYGGNIDDLRLLPPLIRSPLVASLLRDHISGKSLSVHEQSGKVISKYSDSTIQVACDGYLCRKRTYDEFVKEVPLSIGSKDHTFDFERLYCKRFKRADFTRSGVSQKVNEWVKKIDLDREHLLVGQFLSLLWGIPDFFVPYEKFNYSLNTLRGSIDRYYTDWANKEIESLRSTLDFEEPLVFETVPRERYFDRRFSNFKVVIDLNMGEFDSMVYELGKLNFKFNLKFEKKFLTWYRKETLSFDPRNESYKNYLSNTLTQRIKEILHKKGELFIVVPWKGDVSALIAREITEQLTLYQGDFFTEKGEEWVTIPLEFNVAPFALKYLYDEFKTELYNPLGNEG